MVYNAYNIPIWRVGLLFETKKLKHLSKIWLPGILLSFYYRRFNKKYNEWFNKKSSDKLKDLINDWQLLKLKNKVSNLLPALYMSLSYAKDESSKEIYEEHFGKYPNDKDALERILGEIRKVNDMLKALDKPKEQEAGITFTELVARVEASRDLTIDRNISLFEFKTIYDLEIEKWQQKA